MSFKPGLWLHRAGASCLFLGYFPFASGTVGSAAAVGVVWYLHRRIPVLFAPESLMLYWLAIVALTVIGFAVCSRALELFGREDPPQIVFDEFIGQVITFFMVPITIRTLVLGFLLFRFFDIIKPYPVHVMEDLDDGIGVTMDDVAAGVWANVCLLLIVAGYHAVRGMLV